MSSTNFTILDESLMSLILDILIYKVKRLDLIILNCFFFKFSDIDNISLIIL